MTTLRNFSFGYAETFGVFPILPRADLIPGALKYRPVMLQAILDAIEGRRGCISPEEFLQMIPVEERALNLPDGLSVVL